MLWKDELNGAEVGAKHDHQPAARSQCSEGEFMTWQVVDIDRRSSHTRLVYFG
jgi:hypothetical protein